jgi:hypothetical protein
MSQQFSWAQVIVGAILSLIISLAVAYKMVQWTADSAPDHDLSITTQRLDAAADRESIFIPSGEPIFLDPFGTSGVYVEATIPPESVGLYTYTAIVSNTGGFPEQEVEIVFTYESGGASLSLIDLEFTGSSGAMLKTVTVASEQPHDQKSVTYAVPRINPDEWLTFSFSWSQPVELSVVARTSEITEEAEF